MKGSKTLLITIPIAIILFGFVIYQYGYLRIQKDISSIREEQEMKTEVLKKYITIKSEIPNIERELDSLKEIKDSYNAEMIEGETPSIASASLQEIVRGIITNLGGKVTSERIGQPVDLGKFKGINVSIDGSMPDVKALSDFLSTAETHTPFLFVREIDVNIIDYREPRELRIKLNVSAITGGK